MKIPTTSLSVPASSRLPCKADPVVQRLGGLPTARSPLSQPSPPPPVPALGNLPHSLLGLLPLLEHPARSQLWAFTWAGRFLLWVCSPLLPLKTPPSAQIRMKCPLLSQGWLFPPRCLCHIYHVKWQGLSSTLMWPDQKMSYLRTRTLTKRPRRSGVIPATYAFFGT